MNVDWERFAYDSPRSTEELPGGNSSKIRSLEEKIDKLALICRAMWEILGTHADISEDDLLKKVEEIDLRDGKLDGKLLQDAKRCRNCGRMLSKRHRTCLYCGTKEQFESVFDTI